MSEQFIKPGAAKPPVIQTPRKAEEFLNQYELSKRWKISPRTLERWRWLGNGPRYHKIGGRVVYRLSDTDDLRDICIPAHAGQKWAFILTKYNDPFDASSYAEHFSLERRIVSVLGGHSQDLMRMFFPEGWQKEIDALWD